MYFTYYTDREFINKEEMGEFYNHADLYYSSYFYYHDEDNQNKFDSEQFESLKLAIGFSITGLRNQKSFFIFLGPSNTGKSTFVDSLIKIIFVVLFLIN